jgi:hypothetical protein
MRKKILNKILIIGIFVLFFGANVVNGIDVIKKDDVSNEKDLYNDDDPGIKHFYFFVDVDIIVHDAIYCNYWKFDIQGNDFVPFFHASRISSSGGNPVIDISIRKSFGNTEEFTLTDVFSISAYLLTDVDTDLPKYGYPSEGYFDCKAVYLTFSD